MKGKTYRYFDGTPLYPFGYGLSYSSFRYSDLELIPVILAGDDQYIEGNVTNTGLVDSYEVINDLCTSKFGLNLQLYNHSVLEELP